MRQWTLGIVAMSLVAFLGLTGAARAAIIEQGAGDNYVAVEAEDVARIVTIGGGQPWQVVSVAAPFNSPVGNPVLPGASNASGGEALLAGFNAADNDSTATYLFRFNSPGTYRMYIRQSLFESGVVPANYGNEDSYFRPTAFDAPANTTEASSAFGNEGVAYGWRNTGDNYTVSAAQASAPLVAFNIDIREDGYSADRVIFSKSTGLSGAQLDALANSNQITYDPFLYYSFEPPDVHTDNQSTDFSGNFRHGTLSTTGTGAFAYDNSTSPAALPGTQSLALTESGNNNAARITRSISTGELNFSTQSWSFSGWFNRRDAGNDDFIFHLGAGDGFGGGDELYVYAHGANSLTLHLYNSSSQVVNISTTGVSPGTWHHVAVVHGAGDGELSLWLDGVRIGIDRSFALNLSQGVPVVFGGHTAPTFQASRWFDGYLDDLALYDLALSGWQVWTLSQGSTPLELRVPEPGTLSLLALGGIGLLRRRRRRRQ